MSQIHESIQMRKKLVSPAEHIATGLGHRIPPVKLLGKSVYHVVVATEGTESAHSNPAAT